MGEQTHLNLVTPNGENQESDARDRIGFWLFVLTLCLLPIERVVLPFNLKPADSALVLLTLYGLVKAWRSRQRLDFPLIVPMWLILLSSLVATQLGIAHLLSIIAIVQEVYLFAWFIVLTNLLRTFPRPDQDRLMKIWSVIALAEATTTLIGMLRIGPSIFAAEYFQDQNTATGLARAVGTYANSNAAGMYLSVSFFVLLSTSWPIWLRSVLGMWLLAGMFGTGSLGALLPTLGSLVVLMVMASIMKSRQAEMLGGAVVGMGAGVLAIMLLIFDLCRSFFPETGPDVNVRLLALTVGRIPRSLTARFTRIENFWPVYSLHPWGTGPDSSASLGLSLHNDYVAFLFERGPVGLIGWLWMVGATLLAPLRAACQLTDRHQRWRMLALGSGFLASAINALSHEVSHFRQVWLLTVFLFAMSYACQSDRRKATLPASIASADSEGLA